ncbi:MAG: hypothetical protein M1835_001835 [Candelina submexicana]|nr:MAG: hypothetical protein M1835_001835 [Candelina submexicana]
MAGMEQLEIHSKSYLVRWVSVPAGHTISWSVQPHKKSINFGIFKHPGTGSSLTTSLLSSSNYELPPTPDLGSSSRSRSKSFSRNEMSTAIEKLKSIGLTCASWYGKCEADKVAMGKYDVPSDQGGMYALVFDNTFSKQTSKTATFVLLTYPTNAPPPSNHYLHNSQTTGSTTSLGSRSPRLRSQRTDSMDTLPMTSDGSRPTIASLRPNSSSGIEAVQCTNSNCYTGILQKRRRKRHQGWARRFFSLDFTSSTLSYYHSRQSSALRGAIPLSLAAVCADEENKVISVDSGAEVWHLRASNVKTFRGWADALEKASRTINDRLTSTSGATRNASEPAPALVNVFEDKEWGRVEGIVGRISGIRDAVRRLAKDTDPKYMSPSSGLGISPSPPTSDSPNGSVTGDSTNDEERGPFWRRKSSNNRTCPTPAGFRRTISGQYPIPASGRTVSPGKGALAAVHEPLTPHQGDGEMHGHCMALLHDLDSVVADCLVLIAESKQRRRPPINSRVSRHSIDSTASQEFFDADEGDPNQSQLLTIRRDSDEAELAEDHVYDDVDSASCSDIEEAESLSQSPVMDGTGPSLFPSKAISLTPLPVDPIRRRKTVPASTVLPPSLIGFLRKNVGKDLSTISMPVSANEPTSLLQRISEQMEYSSLLDAAISAKSENGERLLYVSAFAVSHLANGRVKERSIRKPFNPMLGETFELVREDLGFRFLAEKVSHRPVCIACQAESQNWTLTQSPMPTQKFWGKSAELITDGRIRVSLHATGDCYSWTTATCFLRNIIAGEKYVEPVNTITILNETTGEKAIVTFKAKGMFSGRSEEVVVQAFGPQGNELPLGLMGKWTSTLTITDHGSPSKIIWQVGDLVDSAPTRYGLTTFAASLNEITPLEENRIPKSDSRLRPDQRAAENGDLEQAEALKVKLEEAQRSRRMALDIEGRQWQPRWFTKISELGEGEEVWSLRTGKEGYWESRARGEWDGVLDVFGV